MPLPTADTTTELLPPFTLVRTAASREVAPRKGNAPTAANAVFSAAVPPQLSLHEAWLRLGGEAQPD